MRIRTVLRSIALVLLAFSLISTLSVFLQLKRMEGDSRVVNFAGIVRGGTQRMIKLELAGKTADELGAKLEKTLKGLINGSEELGLPRATDTDFIAKMKDVEKSWEDLKQTISRARADQSQRAVLMKASEEYFELTNMAVNAAEAYTKGKVTALKILQSLLFILNAIILAFIWIISERKIAKPLTDATHTIGLVADGDLTLDINSRSEDEIGQLYRALQGMVGKLKTMFAEIRASADNVTASSRQLNIHSEQMTQGARLTSEKSNTVAAASEEMSANMRSVASTMDLSTSNVNTVASATEELTSTIRDVASNAERARGITAGAVSQVHALTGRVTELGNSARDIGKISESINAISAQTNLLALNATIEAARAGAAGKGFAIVANEIKELARQTAAATEDIKAKINAIQMSTSNNVVDIENIAQVIQEVNEIVINVAAAIDQQSVAAKEIALNISQAAHGIHEVNGNVSQSAIAADSVARDISDVNVSTADISTISSQVKMNAADLAILAEHLEKLIAQFRVA